MSTDEIIFFAVLVTFSVLCVLAFLTWTISLVCICIQTNVVNTPKSIATTDKERTVEIVTDRALIKSDKNCIDDDDVDERPSLFTPTTNYEGYLSIHTAWAQGRSSIEK